MFGIIDRSTWWQPSWACFHRLHFSDRIALHPQSEPIVHCASPWTRAIGGRLRCLCSDVFSLRLLAVIQQIRGQVQHVFTLFPLLFLAGCRWRGHLVTHWWNMALWFGQWLMVRREECSLWADVNPRLRARLWVHWNQKEEVRKRKRG